MTNDNIIGVVLESLVCAVVIAGNIVAPILTVWACTRMWSALRSPPGGLRRWPPAATAR